MVDRAVSVVLVREEEGVQHPIYYAGNTLLDIKTRNLRVEKIVLALVTTSKKLKAYFQAHQVVVLTGQPLRQILYNLDMLGQLVKWEIVLGENGLQYKPRLTIKGQALTDFIVECRFE